MITYRAAGRDDAAVLTRFNCALALETENRILDAELVRRGVEGGLERSPEVRYFVAESESRVVGQLMLTREWSDWRNGWMAWLQSVYVEKAFRGAGVFRSLLDHAVHSIEGNDAPVCLRLYVETHNEPAMECYRRLGFRDSGYLVMERPGL